MRAARRLPVSAWIGLGLVGSVALTATASEILTRPARWWFVVHLAPAHAIFWAGFALLCAAWLGLGLVARADRRTLLIAGGVWALPLLVGPALFSHDMYSYLAQGDLLRHGVNPYQHGPAALAAVHQSGVLGTVSPIWRHTTAPYGPLFVGLAAIVSAISGSHLVIGVLLMRALELPGLVLLAVFVPRLARTLGADADRATWLAVASPLVLLELVGGGHNDALMAGLLVAGANYAVERRPALAITLCALASMIKLPALAAVAFIAVCWIRDEGIAARVVARVVGSVVLIVGGVVAAVGLATGVGLSWLSGSLLSTPGKVHLSITPSTSIGYTLHSLVEARGSSYALDSVVGAVALALTAAVGAWLLWRVDYERLVPYLGGLLLASILTGPASWPWYLAWGLVLVAVTPGWQLGALLPILIVAGSAVIGPGGTMSLPLTAAPYTFIAYVILAAALLALGGRGGGARPRGVRALASQLWARPSRAGFEVTT
ncbi:MAG: polyprenol phosphomannose-dependent alpha 1,6 mannosyltransferase MptB [Solirubrobacteraceae bacterium]